MGWACKTHIRNIKIIVDTKPDGKRPLSVLPGCDDPSYQSLSLTASKHNWPTVTCWPGALPAYVSLTSCVPSLRFFFWLYSGV
jgi:hypothetical protein